MFVCVSQSPPKIPCFGHTTKFIKLPVPSAALQKNKKGTSMQAVSRWGLMHFSKLSPPTLVFFVSLIVFPVNFRIDMKIFLKPKKRYFNGFFFWNFYPWFFWTNGTEYSLIFRYSGNEWWIVKGLTKASAWKAIHANGSFLAGKKIFGQRVSLSCIGESVPPVNGQG